jgi:quercetin dioxygenase-like cupin family protein
MKITHLSQTPPRELPGRTMFTLIAPEGLGSQHLSMCIIHVAPGQTVRPAHSHPDGEEAIYVLRGRGQVFVRHEGQDEVQPLTAGTAVLFRPSDTHMIRNVGRGTMEVLCCFAPPADPATYHFSPEAKFPD